MESSATQTTCTFCLNSIENGQTFLLERIKCDMLEFISCDLDIKLFLNITICHACDEMLLALFNYKSSCMECEETLFNFIKDQNGLLDLHEIVKHNIKLKLQNALQNHDMSDEQWDTIVNNYVYNKNISVCRMCLSVHNAFDVEERCHLKNNRILRGSVRRCLPELNIIMTKDPIVCIKCLVTIEKLSHFIDLSQRVQKRLLDQTVPTPSAQNYKRKRRKYDVEEDDSDFDVNKAELSEMSDDNEDGEVRIKCHFCIYTSYIKSDVKKHMVKRHYKQFKKYRRKEKKKRKKLNAALRGKTSTSSDAAVAGESVSTETKTQDGAVATYVKEYVCEETFDFNNAIEDDKSKMTDSNQYDDDEDNSVEISEKNESASSIVPNPANLCRMAQVQNTNIPHPNENKRFCENSNLVKNSPVDVNIVHNIHFHVNSDHPVRFKTITKSDLRLKRKSLSRDVQSKLPDKDKTLIQKSQKIDPSPVNKSNESQKKLKLPETLSTPSTSNILTDKHKQKSKEDIVTKSSLIDSPENNRSSIDLLISDPVPLIDSDNFDLFFNNDSNSDQKEKQKSNRSIKIDAFELPEQNFEDIDVISETVVLPESNLEVPLPIIESLDSNTNEDSLTIQEETNRDSCQKSNTIEDSNISEGNVLHTSVKLDDLNGSDIIDSEDVETNVPGKETNKEGDDLADISLNSKEKVSNEVLPKDIEAEDSVLNTSDLVLDEADLEGLKSLCGTIKQHENEPENNNDKAEENIPIVSNGTEASNLILDEADLESLKTVCDDLNQSEVEDTSTKIINTTDLDQVITISCDLEKDSGNSLFEEIPNADRSIVVEEKTEQSKQKVSLLEELLKSADTSEFVDENKQKGKAKSSVLEELLTADASDFVDEKIEKGKAKVSVLEELLKSDKIGRKNKRNKRVTDSSYMSNRPRRTVTKMKNKASPIQKQRSTSENKIKKSVSSPVKKSKPQTNNNNKITNYFGTCDKNPQPANKEVNESAITEKIIDPDNILDPEILQENSSSFIESLRSFSLHQHTNFQNVLKPNLQQNIIYTVAPAQISNDSIVIDSDTDSEIEFFAVPTNRRCTISPKEFIDLDDIDDVDVNQSHPKNDNTSGDSSNTNTNVLTVGDKSELEKDSNDTIEEHTNTTVPSDAVSDSTSERVSNVTIEKEVNKSEPSQEASNSTLEQVSGVTAEGNVDISDTSQYVSKKVSTILTLPSEALDRMDDDDPVSADSDSTVILQTSCNDNTNIVEKVVGNENLENNEQNNAEKESDFMNNDLNLRNSAERNSKNLNENLNFENNEINESENVNVKNNKKPNARNESEIVNENLNLNNNEGTNADNESGVTNENNKGANTNVSEVMSENLALENNAEHVEQKCVPVDKKKDFSFSEETLFISDNPELMVIMNDDYDDYNWDDLPNSQNSSTPADSNLTDKDNTETHKRGTIKDSVPQNSNILETDNTTNMTSTSNMAPSSDVTTLPEKTSTRSLPISSNMSSRPRSNTTNSDRKQDDKLKRHPDLPPLRLIISRKKFLQTSKSNQVKQAIKAEPSDPQMTSASLSNAVKIPLPAPKVEDTKAALNLLNPQMISNALGVPPLTAPIVQETSYTPQNDSSLIVLNNNFATQSTLTVPMVQVTNVASTSFNTQNTTQSTIVLNNNFAVVPNAPLFQADLGNNQTANIFVGGNCQSNVMSINVPQNVIQTTTISNAGNNTVSNVSTLVFNPVNTGVKDVQNIPETSMVLASPSTSTKIMNNVMSTSKLAQECPRESNLAQHYTSTLDWVQHYMPTPDLGENYASTSSLLRNDQSTSNVQNYANVAQTITSNLVQNIPLTSNLEQTSGTSGVEIDSDCEITGEIDKYKKKKARQYRLKTVPGKNVFKQTPKKQFCQECGFNTSDAQTLKLHMIRHTIQSKSVRNDIQLVTRNSTRSVTDTPQPQTATYFCPNCPHSTPDYTSYTKHVRKCCDSALKTHLLSACEYKCRLCVFKTHDENIYKKHQQKHAKVLKCPKCTFTSSTDTGLRQHMTQHTSSVTNRHNR